MDSLRQKLESQGLKNIVYMVINHQGAQAQRLHTLLAEKLPAEITLYKQAEDQPDVWTTLNGEKDDFFIYDRCGRLTQHISLPYSIIGQGHVEKAIRDTYCTRICGDCTHESSDVLEECRESPTEAQPNAEAVPAADPAADPQPRHPGHHQRHHHGHHHGHHHHHPPPLGRHDGHEQHHGNQQQVSQHHQQEVREHHQQEVREHHQQEVSQQGQSDFVLSQMQQVAQVAQVPQVMHRP